MPNTSNFSIPYPALVDPPNAPAQMKDLADAADAMGLTLQNALNARAGGEYRGTGQPMATGANKLSFSATVKAASGITWNGSNTFTVTAAGVYGFYVGASMGFVASANWAVAVHDASGWPAQAYTLYSSPLFSGGQTNSFSSGEKWLDVGQTLCAYAYNNEGTSRTLAGADFRVWRVSR